MLDWWFSKVGYWELTYFKGFLPWYVLVIAGIGFWMVMYGALYLWKCR